MLIKSLTLNGNKRLMLNNITHFKYMPTSAFQLILGTNGSGKTTVLRECSPLPAVSSDYVSGGYKIIDLEHEGESYRLTSLLKGGGSHSIVRESDGEEMNPGGTGKVQKEVIKQLFGYTQDLHMLLCGDLKFTHMSPSKRREWITEISDINLEYALGVYDKLKTRNRDTTGALKHIKGRLTTETAKLLDYTETEDLERRGVKLREELDALFQSQRRGTDPFTQSQDKLNRLMQAFEGVCEEIVKVDLTKPVGVRIGSNQDLRSFMEQQVTDKAVLENTLVRDHAEHDELRNIIKAVGEEGVPDPVELQRLYTEREVQCEYLMGKIAHFFVESDPLEVLLSTKEALGSLVEVFQQIPDNTDGLFTRDQHRLQQTELERVRKEIDKHTNQVARLTSRLEHITHSKDTTCPRCEFEWKEGVGEGERDALEKQVLEHQQQLDELAKQRAVVESALDEFVAYSETYGRFRAIVHNYPRLKLLWDYIQENKCVTLKPKSQIPILHQWEREVELSVEVGSLRNEMRLLLQTLEQLKTVEGVDAQYSKTRFVEVGQRIEATMISLEQLGVEMAEVRRYERTLTQTLQRYSKAEGYLRDIEQLLVDCTEGLRQQHIGTLIYGHQGTLSVVEQKVREKATQVDIVNDLTQSEGTLSVEAEALKLVLSELSPSDGLIAEQLKGFIDCLIGQMNDVIEQVWTYDLRIQPCGMEGEELDYYFPMRVKNEPVADVKFGSTAQLKIVNFAFQLAVMTQLGLTHHPLLLDELGEGLDEQHGTNLMMYVKALIDAGCHSQMLLINHHSAQWGIFAGAEICVLDSTNVTVPQIHNKHVELH